MAFWLFRPGRNDEFFEVMSQFSWLTLSFYGTPDLSHIADRAELRTTVERRYPEKNSSTITKYTNEIASFLWAMGAGDDVIVPFNSGRNFLLGKVLARPYRFIDGLPIRANHVRFVEWVDQFSRDRISDGLWRNIQVQMTIRQLDPELLPALSDSGDVERPMQGTTLVTENQSAVEGTARLVEARLLLRDAGIAERFWRNHLTAQGGIGRCAGCEFTHPDRGMFDIHHAQPLAQGQRTTTLADLLVLCPRCHRTVHHRRGAYPLSLDELRNKISGT